MTAVDLLEQALSRRALPARTDAFRWVNGEADGFPGVMLDRLGEVAVLSLYRELSPVEEQALADAVMSVGRTRALYLKRRPKEARVVANVDKDRVAPEQPARGEPVEQCVAEEQGLRFLIRPGQGLSVGLYLDARELRRWVREQSRDRTLLNCFAYTCGFGIAALAGGARRAVNLDVSRRVLDWGAENAALNGQNQTPGDAIAGDVFDWLNRFRKKGESFDDVLLDPPSFATTRRSRFSAASDYADLAEQAARVVAPSGRLIACCNLASLARVRFEAMVAQGLAAAGRSGTVQARLAASEVDFPLASGQSGGLKVAVYALD